MLTGASFNASDPLSEFTACCETASNPEQTERIPEPISAIVLKLLAKTAEERYQTAAGLEADLRKCLMEWSPSDTSSRSWWAANVPDRL